MIIFLSFYFLIHRLSLIAHFRTYHAACRIAYGSLRPANLGVRWARGTSHVSASSTCDAAASTCMRVRVSQWSTASFPQERWTHGSSVIRPGVPDRRDHVRGRRVFCASLLHVVHQRAVLALVRVEIRLLTARHAAAIPGIHLLQMIQRLA